jgi:hypothetical protein
VIVGNEGRKVKSIRLKLAGHGIEQATVVDGEMQRQQLGYANVGTEQQGQDEDENHREIKSGAVIQLFGSH